MRSFGELFFDLFMDFYIFLQVEDLFLEVLVLEKEFLGLFWLELQLACELMVLKYC